MRSLVRFVSPLVCIAGFLAPSAASVADHGFGKAELATLIASSRSLVPPSFSVVLASEERADGGDGTVQRRWEERVSVVPDGFHYAEWRDWSLQDGDGFVGTLFWAAQSGQSVTGNVEEGIAARSSDVHRLADRFSTFDYFLRNYVGHERVGVEIGADLLKVLANTDVEVEPQLVQIEGATCVVLSRTRYGEWGRAVVEMIALDIERGFTPRLQRQQSVSGEIFVEYKVLSYLELSPGFFVPDNAVVWSAPISADEIDGDPSYETGATRVFSIPRDNAGMPLAHACVGETDLLALPAGTSVLDVDTGEHTVIALSGASAPSESIDDTVKRSWLGPAVIALATIPCLLGAALFVGFRRPTRYLST